MRVIYRKIRHARCLYIKRNAAKVCGARYTLGARYLSKNAVYKSFDLNRLVFPDCPEVAFYLDLPEGKFRIIYALRKTTRTKISYQAARKASLDSFITWETNGSRGLHYHVSV